MRGCQFAVQAELCDFLKQDAQQDCAEAAKFMPKKYAVATLISNQEFVSF
jgi:hypothetical protein